MKFESFLENLYFGKLDKSSLIYSESSKDDPVVADIISKFKDATKDFPPDKLEELKRIPDELISKFKKIGFFGLFIPKKYGGKGFTLHQYLAVVKEIVKFDMAVGILSLAHLSIGMKAILLFGNEEQKQKYLTQAASGEMIFCYALTEPLIGSDAKNIDTHAELSPDGKFFILNGTKTFITNANYSKGLTVFAQMDKSKKGTLGAFIVETGWDGVAVGKDAEKMGLIASSTASIQFKNVKVPKENLIGNSGDGFKIAMKVLNFGRLALGASSSGMLEASFDDMLKRSKNRIQFENPIFNYELIQEKIIKAYVENEIIWSMTNFTASLLEKDMTGHVAIESSHCKFYGTNRSWDTLYDAMQVAGGSGYLKTNPYEKRMRDSRVATIFEGTTEIHSIYPPISVLRNVVKQIFVKDKPFISRMFALFYSYLKPALWNTFDKDPLLRKSLSAVKSYAKIYRKMFISSLLKYGKKLSDKEFLLRRLTVISCQLFGILSIVLKIKYLKKNNLNAEKAHFSLMYFLSNSQKIVFDNYRIKTSETEKIHKMIINSINS